MGKKLQPAQKGKSKISKEKKNKPKTEETIIRDRLKADLSRFKDRLLKAYTRTLPDMIMKNIDQSPQDIKEASMKRALEKFIYFQNNYAKRQEQFKLSAIHPQIRECFWSFVFNLQKYRIEELSQLTDRQLMWHHAPITSDDLEIFITKYLPQHRDDFTCESGIINFSNRQKQNKKKPKRNNQNEGYYRERESRGKKIYNISIFTFAIMFCILGLFSNTGNGETERRYLQTNQNPSRSPIQYGIDMTAITKVDFSANQINKVSQNAWLIGAFALLIITLICACVVICSKIFQREILLMKEKMSSSIQFILNRILKT